MASSSEWQISKSEASSDVAVVATMYRLATEVGADVLRRGGSAGRRNQAVRSRNLLDRVPAVIG